MQRSSGQQRSRMRCSGLGRRCSGLGRLTASGARWRLLIVTGVALGLLTVGVASAGGATTAVSSFSKSGVDEATGSTATGSASGQTAAGHTLDWVLSYRNTTSADAQVNITDPLVGNHTYVPGSLQVPPGFSPQWSTDGGASYTTTEPASGVNAVGATGTNGPGSTGSRSPVPPPARGFSAGTSNGDGWEPLFIGENVYNVHHHDGPNSSLTMLDCHDKSSGQECPGYPGVGAYVSATAGVPFSTGPDTLGTAYAPNADVDAVSGHIYFPVGVDGQGGIGVLCADVIAQTSCGYTQLGVSPITNKLEGGEWHAAIDGGAVIGSRYYLVDAQANVYCFDTSANAACGGPYPIKAIPGYPASSILRTSLDSRLQAFDGRYVLGNITEPNGSRDLTCIDTTTNALCPGFPVRGYATDFIIAGGATQFNAVLAPTLSASGNVTGVCGQAATNATSAPFKCYLVGGATPGTLIPTPWPQQVPGSTVTRAGLGSITSIGAKLYFPYSNETAGFRATYACWSFATNSACSGFVQASSGRNVRAYTVRQDPDNPGCVWELGDAGVFEVFSATFGGTTCSEGAAVINLAPESSYCDGRPGHVTGWNNLVLSGVTSTDYDSVAVSILDANGNPVPGWTDRVFPSTQQTIDISSISYAGSTTSLQIAVSINWGAHTPKPTTVLATFAGDPVQVCFKTIVGPATCGDQSVANAATAVTDAGAAGSDAPAGNGSGTATFIQAGDPGACRADLQIVKRALGEVIVPGKDTTYTLEVINHGPDPAQDVVVSDRLPAGLSFVSASPGCAFASDTVTCRVSSLAVGAAETLTVVAHVASSVDHRIANTAEVMSATPDSNLANNTSTITQPINQKVDVAITKTASAGTVAPGGQVTYTLVVSNHGPSDATGVTVTDSAPAGLSLVSADPAQGSCTFGAELSCALGSLPTGGATQILVVARIVPSFHGALTNTATVTQDQLDTDVSNNASHTNIDVPAPPTAPQPASDLQIVKHVSAAAAYPGQKLTYTLKVTNRGGDKATDARVTDTSTLPLRILSVRSSKGECQAGPPVFCRLGTVAVGKEVTITIIAEVRVAGEQINAGSATSADRDTDTTNNLSRTRTKVTPVIDIRTSPSASVVPAGLRVGFTIKVINHNDVPLRDVRVCQVLPAGLVLVSGHPKPKLKNGVYCWTLRKLGAGRSAIFTVRVRTLRGARGARTAHASATAAGAREARARATVRVIAPLPPPGGVTG